MQIDRALLVAGRWAGGLAAAFLLAPAVAQQAPDAPSTQATASTEAATTIAIQSTAATATEGELPPIPDPPRFLSDMISNVEDVNGDLFLWGQSVTLAGNILNNAFVGASSVTIDGTVGSDAFAFAQSIIVTGEVKQNVYAMGATTTITEDAVIHGNLICFCGMLIVNGTVRGQILGSGGATTLTGHVGSMNLEVGNLTVSSTAIVHGDLEYEGNEQANVEEGAQIGGELRWNQETPDDDDVSEASDGFSFWNIAGATWWYLANLTVGVAFLLFGGRLARAPVERLREQAAVGLGFGFVVTVVVPVACLIAALMLVTLPLGFIVMQFYLLAVFLARLVTAQFLGDWLLRRTGQQQPSEYLALAGGLVLFFVLTEIPYVGFLIWLTALFLGVGGLFLAARGRGPATAVSG